MSIRRKVWKYGDDVNTDVIFPGKYTYTITDPNEMAQYALEDLDPEFAVKVNKNDVIIAGENFGCGSSREQAAICLKYAGVGAVIAKSFSRIFFRNAINQALPVIECKEAVDNIKSNDEVKIDFEKGEISCDKGVFSFSPLPKEILEIFNDGGLIPHVKKILKIKQGE
ncbi:MAG: 3-isopropylmalate dehydratase small subunit [Candidatus Caldatribacteriota bacterium]|nr:3-isopropylmalate dehydratase small subunit [Candidatus Caldatribacteriota bacterium]